MTDSRKPSKIKQHEDINWDRYEDICDLGPEEFIPGIEKMWNKPEHDGFKCHIMRYILCTPNGQPYDENNVREGTIYDDDVQAPLHEWMDDIKVRWNMPEHQEWKEECLKYMMMYPTTYPTFRETLSQEIKTPPKEEQLLIPSSKRPQCNAQKESVQDTSKFLGLIRKLTPKAKQTAGTEGQQASAQPKRKPKNAHDPTREK